MSHDFDGTRHLIASIAYRFNVAVKDAPENFGNHDVGNGGWTPAEIVRHMTHVVKYAQFVIDEKSEVTAPEPSSFSEECSRFIQQLSSLDEVYTSSTVSTESLKKIIQGPLADITTHVGQLAMARRQAGSPIVGENYMKADVEAGKF